MLLVKRLIIGWLTLSGLVVLAALVLRRRVSEFGTTDDNQFSVVAAMAGREFRSRATNLEAGSVLAFAGGVELDLSDAQIDHNALLRIKAVMGGVDVIVPSTWRVEVFSRSVMGGIGNLTAPDEVASDAPLLVVNADAVLGGVEIHAAEET